MCTLVIGLLFALTEANVPLSPPHMKLVVSEENSVSEIDEDTPPTLRPTFIKIN